MAPNNALRSFDGATRECEEGQRESGVVGENEREQMALPDGTRGNDRTERTRPERCRPDRALPGVSGRERERARRTMKS